jgi:O-acetyl-ADP-ribose deacetylase (regulator of RNase III)
VADDVQTFADTTVELVVGDIAAQPGVDAVVNAANAQLMPGGGVAGAIHRAAGPGLAEECRPLAPIRVGPAVVTGGHGLPTPHVIHALGPVHGHDVPSDEKLAETYRNVLLLADREGFAAVALPAISTGAFGYPVREAARIALATVAEVAPRLAHVRRVRFVLFDTAALEVHRAALAGLTEG